MTWLYVITAVMFGGLLLYVVTGVLADLAAEAAWRPVDASCRPGSTDIRAALHAEVIARSDRLAR